MLSRPQTDCRCRTPLEYATACPIQGNGDPLNRAIDTMRLFSDCFDFPDGFSEGWVAVLVVMGRLAGADGDQEAELSFFKWIVQQSYQDIRENFRIYHFWINFSLARETIAIEFLSFLVKLNPSKSMNFNDRDGRRLLMVMEDILHATSCFQNTDDAIVSRSESYNPIFECSSRSFWLWRYFLHETGANMDVLLDKEIERGTLAKDGWSRETLQTVFDWEFEYAEHSRSERHCSDCGEPCTWPRHSVAEPLWLSSLDQIKRGVDPEKTMWALCTSEKNTSRELNSINAPSLAIDDNSRAASSTNIATATEVVSQDSRSDSHMPAFPYGRDDTICRNCWVDFCNTGIRRRRQQSHDLETSSSDGGSDVDTSDDEFSPFHIHS